MQMSKGPLTYGRLSVVWDNSKIELHKNTVIKCESKDGQMYVLTFGACFCVFFALLNFFLARLSVAKNRMQYV